MKKVLLFLMFAISTFTLIACTPEEDDFIPIEEPEKVKEVTSIVIQHGSANVNGVLSVDLSVGTINLNTRVLKTDDSVDDSVTYTSSNKEIATIANSGLVTLLAEGETLVTATAGNKTHTIVLVVGDDFTEIEQFSVTVIGGSTDKTSAAVGSYITLTPAMPDHTNFIKWEYRIDGELVDDLWLNGSVFAMPNNDITITAIYEDRLYTLSVIDGVVEGNDSGKLVDDRLVYQFKFNDEIKVVANDEPENKMFVGWDYKIVNNRVGNLGVQEYSFTMPDEEITMWAVYSDYSSMNFPNAPHIYNEVAKGYKLITNGIPAGESVDSDLEGMSGYRFAIEANTLANTGAAEIIRGSNLNTLESGTNTIKVIFKNNHETLPITVELFASQYRNLASSELVTIQPGEVVTNYFQATIGFRNPWMDMKVRADIGGEAGDFVLLDMVVQKAATYPSGDKQLQVSGNAEWVTVGSNYNSPEDKKLWSGYKYINNEIGLSSLLAWANTIDGVDYAMWNEITNMPSLDEDVTIYFRTINSVDTPNTTKFHIGTSKNPSEETKLGEYEIEVQPKGVEVFSITIPKTLDVEQIYINVITSVVNSSPREGYILTFQMAYNNVFGVEE